MKILFIGPMGAGKTTAITALSDIPPIATEAQNFDQLSAAKATTTVAMDYGELHLSSDEFVALYGIPGQAHFSFMWEVLAQGALGAILLLNHLEANALQQLDLYLDAFPELVACGAVVVAVGHAQAFGDAVLAPYQRVLSQRGLALPLFVTDVRYREQVQLLVESLIANAEVTQFLDGHLAL
ncbi:GTP-binding protein [Pseudomonas sp. F1_0610]|uniref:GTP-binding protein n=1 Tax=Pseudomonas sp. F1_0610 TaxID=3114284 RepID=UPI0039C336B6